MNANKSHNWLWIVLLLMIMASMGTTFYKYVIMHDYEIIPPSEEDLASGEEEVAEEPVEMIEGESVPEEMEEVVPE